MSQDWTPLPYEAWTPCRDTLHALTQVLGKVAVSLAPPEPQLQHGALRVTPRGWETAPLPAPGGGSSVGLTLDLVRHRIAIEHSSGATAAIAITGRPVGAVTRELLDALAAMVGPVPFNPVPQEVAWTTPLDEDEDHRQYDPESAGRYHAAAVRAALVLAAYRAPFRGRATPVNAWWGSFDLAVSLFSGQAAQPPSDDFIMRNAMDAQEVAVGWWPGDARHPRAAFYAYAHPAPAGFEDARLEPAPARWEAGLGEFVLDWDDVVAAQDPHAFALAFLRSASAHSCAVCDWSPRLAASLHGDPPPVV